MINKIVIKNKLGSQEIGNKKIKKKVPQCTIDGPF